MHAILSLHNYSQTPIIIARLQPIPRDKNVYGAVRRSCSIGTPERCAPSRMDRKVLLTTLEWVTNFFGKIWRVTLIYHIALCLPINLVWHSLSVLEGTAAAIISVCFRREHPFLRWLYKSLCSTNFAGQSKHFTGQSHVWDFLMCRRNLDLRTLLRHPSTQHFTCTPLLPFPLAVSDIMCFTASRRSEKCLPGHLKQWKRISDIA